MTDRKSSAEMASVAGRIMDMAKFGGPVKHHEAALRDEFALTGGDAEAVLGKIKKVFQPYFDDAESLAASVLSQRAK
jgi:hypothetical protein